MQKASSLITINNMKYTDLFKKNYQQFAGSKYEFLQDRYL